MKATAVTTRSDGWWSISVREVDGAFTQARRLDDVPRMAAGAVGLLSDVDPSEVEITVELVLADDLASEITAARQEVAAAAEAQRAAGARQRSAARRLRELGLTGRDASEVLHISPQRYSQLING